jgi:hypothetical protein
MSLDYHGLDQAFGSSTLQVYSRQGQSAPEDENARRPTVEGGTLVNTPLRSGQEKSINHFFGDLENRGLVNLSYYNLYS